MATPKIKSANVFADLSAPEDKPEFQQFLDLFEGKDRELVRDVLWKLNAPANLGMIGTIGKRLERVLLQYDKLKRAFSEKSDADRAKKPKFVFLNEVRKFCNLIRVNRLPIEQLLGDHAFSEPESSKINPLRGKSLTRHGVYAALLNAPELKPDQDNWDLIALRLLLANCKAMEKWGRAEYETYGGANKEAKAMPVKLYAASRYLRTLTKEDFKHLIGHLTEQEIVGSGLIRGLGCVANAEQWLTLRGNELNAGDQKPRPRSIFEPLMQVLDFCYRSENNLFRAGGTRRGGSRSVARDGSKHYWGPEHVLIDKQNQIINVGMFPFRAYGTE